MQFKPSSCLLATFLLAFVLGANGLHAQANFSVNLQSQEPRVRVPFQVVVKNNSPSPLLTCVDFSMGMRKGNAFISRPHPFILQRWYNGKWMTQLIGSDVGNPVHIIAVDPAESKTFEMQIDSPGRYRLVLEFSKRAEKCPLEGKKTYSMPFNVK